MSVLLFGLIACAGGVGAALRLAVDGFIRARARVIYPLGTTVINVTGSLLLGLVTGLALTRILPEELALILGSGLLGGYTTFSTASYETIRLIQEGRWLAALVNGPGMLLLCVLAAAAGLWVGAML